MKTAAKATKIMSFLLALCLFMGLAGLLGTPVSAQAIGIPQPVLDARQSVVRIISVYSDEVGDFAVGSGFIVGEEDDYYVVTNYHVVEDARDVHIYYDTDKYVEGIIVREDPGRDLCVLEPKRNIPGAEIIPISERAIDTGIPVYALGFPFGADMLGLSYDDLMEGNIQLYSDKGSMTVTSGTISSVRVSRQVGYESQEVKVIVSDASISGGNSGGPLVDEYGHVVGINTLSYSGGGLMSVSIHYEELMDLLDDLDIYYITADGSIPLPEPEPEPVLIQILPFLLIGGGVLVAVIVVVVLMAGRRKKARQEQEALKGTVPLEAFENRFKKIDEVGVAGMTRNFLAQQLSVPGADLSLLLTPQNVLIGDSAISLKSQTPAVGANPLAVYPGFSGPDIYYGYSGAPAQVYFVGAMMYTLCYGRRPPEAMARTPEVPLFRQANTLRDIISSAMALDANARYADLPALLQALDYSLERIRDENHP